jgi:alanine racemase
MVRVGVLLYGYWPTRETWLQFVYDKKSKRDPLKRVMTWKTQVMDVKKVKSGGFIGYGLGYQAQEDMKIMIIPVGYANGYSRNLSNNGHVLVKKQRADIIGYINMNITICNITHIKNVKQGDEVTLLGQQGMNKITFASFADMNNAMNYEISARLPENIERVLIA